MFITQLEKSRSVHITQLEKSRRQSDIFIGKNETGGMDPDRLVIRQGMEVVTEETGQEAVG